MRKIVCLFAVAILLVALPVSGAQFGAIKKLGQKIKKAIPVELKHGDKKQQDQTAPAAPTNVRVVSGSDSIPEFKLRDDEPAFVPTKLSIPEATKRIKQYFDDKDMEPRVDPDTGTLTTDYGMNRHCGPGFYRCEDKVQAKFITHDNGTVVRLRVLQRKHESGMNTKPWKEENKSNGKETSKMAKMLYDLLNK